MRAYYYMILDNGDIGIYNNENDQQVKVVGEINEAQQWIERNEDYGL